MAELAWIELVVREQHALDEHYGPSLGWTSVLLSEDPARHGWICGGRIVGGVRRMEPSVVQHGTRSAWLIYVGVRDVGRVIGRAERHGGISLMEPTVVARGVEYGIVTHRAGGPLGVIRTRYQGERQMSVGRAGDLAALLLCSPDAEASVAYHAGAFGWTFDRTPYGYQSTTAGVPALIVDARRDIPAAAHAQWLPVFASPDRRRRDRTRGHHEQAAPSLDPGRWSIRRDPAQVWYGVASTMPPS